MRIRFLTSCLAVLITASTGFCQDETGEPAEPVRLVNPDPNAPTPARDVQLLNPDGTPATDAKVVTVLHIPGVVVVDQNLKPRRFRNVPIEPLSELVNDNGKVNVPTDVTKAIVAANEQGFLFLPASAFGERAKLREWAYIDLDVSTVPQELRADVRLNVLWTNSLQGAFTRHLSSSSTPFLEPFESTNWNLMPYITWTHWNLGVENQRLRVPPGEISISLSSSSFNENDPVPTAMPQGAFTSTVGMWRVSSGTTEKVVLPEFGSVEGTVSSPSKTALPDWNKSGDETDRFVLNSYQTLPEILTHTDERINVYLSKLASDEGFRARQETILTAMTTLSDGKFRIPLVPVRTYRIGKLVEAPDLIKGGYGTLALAFVRLGLKGDRDTSSVVVKTSKTTIIDAEVVPQSEPNLPEPMSEGDVSSSQANTAPLAQTPPPGAEIRMRQVRRQMNGKEEILSVPYVVYPQTPSEGDPDVSPMDQSSSDDPNALTPAEDIQILNPDGTPATDAGVVAIRTIGVGSPLINPDLQLTPTNLAERQQDVQSIIKLENDHGTVLSPADAKAIVASNDQGFVFLPSNAQIQTAQLRAWASVRIDTSSIPDTMKDKLKLRILWSNNFCGMYPGHGLMAGLGVPLAKKDPSPDWRFDPFVYWCRDLKVRENADAFKVPPGEVSVMLIAMDSTPVHGLLSSYMIVHGITTSNMTTEIVFPKFGSLRGTLASMNKSGLPDWGQSGRIRVGLNPVPEKSAAAMEFHRRFENIATPNVTNINGVPRVEPTAQDWNDYADFLSTDDGFGFRTNGFQSLMTEVESDGSFLFPLVPVGEYTLTRLTPVASPPDLISRTGEPSEHLSFSVEAIVQSGDEQRTPLKVTVKENECNDLAQLAAAATDTSHVITYGPPPDTATLLVQDWLRSAKDPSDQAELRKLLQDHLQQEFEANQASRKAEVERLQRLLLQSVEWLDKRAKNRDEIIQKRIDELIQNSVPEKSATPN